MKFKIEEQTSGYIHVYDDNDKEYKFPIAVLKLRNEKDGTLVFNMNAVRSGKPTIIRAWRALAYTAGLIPLVREIRGSDGYRYILKDKSKGVVSGNLMITKNYAIVGSC